MGLLNLTLAQFLALLIPLTGLLVALYYYDRARRRLRVSTLRFWPRTPAPPAARRQKKIQQPLSLALQLLALLLLLLAIADFRFGLSGGEPRRHVIVVDASAAMRFSAGAAGGTRMDLARARSLEYLRALPASDRVAVIRAAGAPSVEVPFTSNRQRLRQALAEMEAGWTAIDLEAALELARTAIALDLGQTADGLRERRNGVGEVAYVGAGRLPEVAADRGAAQSVPFLRYIEIPSEGANLGVRRLSAQRVPDDPSRWEVTFEAANDSAGEREIPVTFLFAGHRLGERVLRAPARSAAALDFRIRAEQAGALEAVIGGGDALAEDDRVTLELPAALRRALAIVTARPSRWQPLVEANPHIRPVFTAPGETPPLDALTVLDQPRAAARARIYIDPDENASPVLVARRVSGVRIASWAAGHPLAAGLRETDLRLTRASVFQPGPDDIVIADSAAGPVAVARAREGENFVVFGFDPLEASLANRLTTPLLFANAVRWFAPEVFRVTEHRAGPPGAAEVDTGAAGPGEIRVVALEGSPPVWSWDEGRVRLFSGRPGVYAIETPFQRTLLSLTLPEIGRRDWLPPEGVLRGVPRAQAGAWLAGLVLWPWLAMAALLLLLADWIWFGRGSRQVGPGAGPPASAVPASSAAGEAPRQIPVQREEEALR